MSTDAPAAADVKCTRCDRVIEVCFCCGEPDCAGPVCYRCLIVAVGQLRPPRMIED